jgi:hypothetical protein
LTLRDQPPGFGSDGFEARSFKPKSALSASERMVQPILPEQGDPASVESAEGITPLFKPGWGLMPSTGEPCSNRLVCDRSREVLDGADRLDQTWMPSCDRIELRPGKPQAVPAIIVTFWPRSSAG